MTWLIVVKLVYILVTNEPLELCFLLNKHLQFNIKLRSVWSLDK